MSLLSTIYAHLRVAPLLAGPHHIAQKKTRQTDATSLSSLSDKSGFPVYFNFARRLHQRADSLAKQRNNVNRSFCNFSITTFMTKQPIMIRVVVVCPVTGCYRVVWQPLQLRVTQLHL